MKKKKIIIITARADEGAPVMQRTNAYIEYFRSIQYECIVLYFDDSRLIFTLLKYAIMGARLVLITMPPFRFFSVYFIPCIRIITDIRDGWSIAIESGYGGLIKRRPFIAKIVRLIEKFVIIRSWLVITCTPGLKKYLEKISGSRVLLLLNGVSNDKYRLISSHFRREGLNGNNVHNGNEIVRYLCAGKFAEYGRDKAERVIGRINLEQPEAMKKLVLIGCSVRDNAWLKDFLDSKWVLEIKPRMSEQDIAIELSTANYGICIIRDPSYDMGTKVYDYLAAGLNVITNANEGTEFTDFLTKCKLFKNSQELEKIIVRDISLRDVLDPIFRTQ